MTTGEEIVFDMGLEPGSLAGRSAEGAAAAIDRAIAGAAAAEREACARLVESNAAAMDSLLGDNVYSEDLREIVAAIRARSK